jgi:hypothetical protein
LRYHRGRSELPSLWIKQHGQINASEIWAASEFEMPGRGLPRKLSGCPRGLAEPQFGSVGQTSAPPKITAR